MSEPKRSPFDVPVEDISETYPTMPELMASYRSFKNHRDFESAKAVLFYGMECGYLPAKLETARLLKTTPQLEMSQNDRFLLSEKLYREILNDLDLSDRAIAAVSMELADLYETINRPVACLGAMLRAKRFGYHVHGKELEKCYRKLKRMDVNDFCHTPQDCYDLGIELAMAGVFEYAEMFLRESLSAENQEMVGRSCLTLADLYFENSIECPMHRLEAIIMYREAARRGFPECLSRKRAG